MDAKRIPAATEVRLLTDGCATTSEFLDGYSVTVLKAGSESTYVQLVTALQKSTSRCFRNGVPKSPPRSSRTSTRRRFFLLALFTSAKRSLINETVYKQVMVSAVDRKISQMREAKAKEL